MYEFFFFLKETLELLNLICYIDDLPDLGYHSVTLFPTLIPR